MSKNITKIITLFVFLIIFFIVPTNNTHAAILVRPPTNLGLVGYWPMDEGVGTKVMDLSGRGSAGTISGATWTSGKRGGALSFNGVNETGSSVTLPSYLIGAPNSIPFTISFWLYWDSSDPDTLVTPFRDSTNIAGTGTFFPAQSGSNIYFRLGSINSTSVGGVSSYQNKWVHFVLTNNTSVATLYADGVVVTTGTPGSFSNVSPWVVGRNGTAAERDKSKFDDIRIYNRALTATEVANLYKSGQVTRKQVSNQGLVGYWSFNEGTGTKVGDSSGYANNGTITGATWTSGKKGGALSFGTGKFVNAGTSDTLNMTGDFTASAWFKTPGPGLNNWGIIMGRANASYYLNPPYKGWYIVSRDIAGSNAISFQYSGASASRNISWTWVPDNLWHHVMVVKQGNLTSLYIDGVFKNSDNPDVGDMSASGETMFIGKGRSTEYFNGQLDDIRIYNRALTATEVQNLYKQNETMVNAPQNDKLTNGLVGLWSFDGKDVNWATGVAYDRSGNGNDGNIANMSTTTSPAMGKIGQALKFDGTDDYVNAGSGASLDNIELQGGGGMSVAFWVKPFSNKTATLVGKGLASNGNGAWSIKKNNTTDPARIAFSKEGGTDLATNWNSFLTTGVWTYVVLTWDGSMDVSGVKAYKNGSLDGQDFSTNGATGNSDANNDLNIGGDSSFFADALMDDVRIYSRVLSASEVKQLYNLGR